MIFIYGKPVATETITCPGSIGIVTICRTIIADPPVIVQLFIVYITGIAGSEMNGEDRWFECAVDRLCQAGQAEEK